MNSSTQAHSPTHGKKLLWQALFDEDSFNKSVEHYGHQHVVRVLGRDGLARVLDVKNNWYVPSVSSDSLSQLVVGFRLSAGKRLPAMLLLAGQGPRAFESRTNLTPDEQMSADLMRLRSGLMRRETAELVVKELTNRSSTTLDEGLEWSVVPGPTVEQTVQEWLGQWDGAERILIRRLIGFEALPNLDREIPCTAFLLTRSETRRNELLSLFGPVLIEPPPRYYLSGVARGGHDGLPGLLPVSRTPC